MFTPPCCPNPDCSAHTAPPPPAPPAPDGEGKGKRFFRRAGYYHPKCRALAVPRFKCLLCNRGFSRQTFRMDYCDNKPYLNPELFKNLASGMGLRQSARIMGLSRRCTELKARKLSRHLGRLNRNLTGEFTDGSRFSLDEMVTFEGERGARPVSVAVLIETNSMYVIASDVATIRASGKMTNERREAIAQAEERYGPREDRSKNALSRTFRRFRALTKNMTTVHLTSDKKHEYSRLLREFFADRAVHLQISSKLKRDQNNPLKHINLTNAMARDLCGRLRRESWLVSKARRFLRLQLHVFAAYRNFIRRRVNRFAETPAKILGFLSRTATFSDLLTWRQDWKLRSIHPMARRSESVAQVREAAAVK